MGDLSSHLSAPQSPNKDPNYIIHQVLLDQRPSVIPGAPMSSSLKGGMYMLKKIVELGGSWETEECRPCFSREQKASRGHDTPSTCWTKISPLIFPKQQQVLNISGFYLQILSTFPVFNTHNGNFTDTHYLFNSRQLYILKCHTRDWSLSSFWGICACNSPTHPGDTRGSNRAPKELSVK